MLQYDPAGKPDRGTESELNEKFNQTNCCIQFQFQFYVAATRLERFAHAAALGHGEESLIAARHGHGAAGVPVVGNVRSGDRVTESNHFGDGVPAVLAHPAATAAAVRVDGHVRRSFLKIKINR